MEFKPTVFVIDDDVDDQDIFSIAISRTNKPANCVFASDGIHAIEKLMQDSDFTPDFIFIDMNMPRMNGKETLMAIKKIDRVRNIPVYMYSTSADPNMVKENVNLGAEDFIVKPSDINAFTNILTNILQKHLLAFFLCIFCLCAFPENSLAQDDQEQPVKELKKLTVEELMNVVVTSVSKSPEKLSEVASALQVITNEDVTRSCVARLPEALRLASNMQVAQSGSHDWGITARGFNGLPVTSSSLANKLLVLIDGRSVYTPLFGGVFWDVQNVYLPDLEQIEVISGPGGALWGANAVNGIVNVISKHSSQTQGWNTSIAVGSLLRDHVGLRYGSSALDSKFHYRIYGQRFDYNNTTLPNDIDALDSWHIMQGGFRMDYTPSDKNNHTLQGDLYGGVNDDTGSTYMNGQNILWKWSRTISETSGLSLQTYIDRTYRDIQSQGFIEDMVTYDLEFQHNFSVNSRNRIVWGVGYRLSDNEIMSELNNYHPPQKNLTLFSGFVQDQIAIVQDRAELTVGTKLIQNNYTDFELQPTIRFAWTPNQSHTVWTAFSNAVRTPTRFDADLNGAVLGSYGSFQSEKVYAYEIGYKMQPTRQVSFSLAAFYNHYADLRSIDTNQVSPPFFYFANNLESNSTGVELSANYIVTEWCRLRGGYTFLDLSFTNKSSKTYPLTHLFEAIDPRNQFLFQSIMNISAKFQVDVLARYVDDLPPLIDGTKTTDYFALDVRVAYKKDAITLSVCGQNLLEDKHIEFGYNEIPRSIMVKISAEF